MVQVHIHRDGLLERFGRPVPDGAALAAALRRLHARLGAGPRPVPFAVAAVRFDATTAAEVEVEGLPLEAVDAPERLPADGLLFTASHARCREAVAADRAAYLVGLGVPPEERGLAFTDVPRILEEALRLPSPRPMAAAVRKGGLLAIPVAGPADARARALEVMRVDPNADWVTLGDSLVLYTEEPDLEDRLAEEPGVEHLSYGVNKQSLVVELEAGGGDGGALLRRPGFALREAGGRAAGVAGATALPWNRARRRIFAAGRQRAAAAPPPPPSAEDFHAALQRYREPAAEAARSAADDPAEAMLAAIRRLAGAAAGADLLRRDGRPAALAWTAPYGDAAEHDELAVLVEDLPAARAGETGGVDGLAGAVAAALATADLLRGLPAAPGALHVVRLRPETPLDEIWPPFLLVDERTRVREVVAGADEVERRTALAALAGER